MEAKVILLYCYHVESYTVSDPTSAKAVMFHLADVDDIKASFALARALAPVAEGLEPLEQVHLPMEQVATVGQH